MTDPIGLARGLTNYGDPDFALYLRRSFARSMGYSLEMLQKPVVGNANTFSGFNNCHRLVPDLVENLQSAERLDALPQVAEHELDKILSLRAAAIGFLSGRHRRRPFM